MRRRRADISLVKVYKDLMITKRELIDLKESIAKTIREIKQIDQLANQFKRPCLQCGVTFDPAVPHHCNRLLRVKCPLCQFLFSSEQSMRIHKESKHNKCRVCLNILHESQDWHDRNACGETEVSCEGCNMKIKRKYIDQHIKVCCFRNCFRCKQDIYAKAYNFHLQECRKINRNTITKSKKIPQINNSQRQRPQILPCCLVIQN